MKKKYTAYLVCTITYAWDDKKKTRSVLLDNDIAPHAFSIGFDTLDEFKERVAGWLEVDGFHEVSLSESSPGIVVSCLGVVEGSDDPPFAIRDFVFGVANSMDMDEFKENFKL